MAGLSVCGLALAAFPIAISALEQYKEVARVRMRLEWRKTMNELKYHQLLFVRNTRLLVAPVVDDVELHQLTTSPSEEVWSNPDLARALEERLEDSYNIFLKTILRVSSALNHLINEIHGDNSDISKGNSGKKEVRQGNTIPTLEQLGAPRATKSQALHVKFTLGESVRKDVFDDIQACNDILEKLIRKTDIVSISYVTDKIRLGFITPSEAALSNFWRHAEKLYKALLTAWKCECPVRHSADLELQPGLSGSDREIREVRLVLSTHTRNSIWSTLPVIVKIEKEPTRSSIRLSSQQEARTEWAPGSKRKMTVRFADTPSAEKHIGTNSSMPFKTQVINNLCTTLSSISSLEGLSSNGYLRDEDGGKFHDRFYIRPGKPTSAISKPLSELIGEGVRSRLTRRQRYYLAVTISSSFIQLKDTSWFPRTSENPWSKNSIFIPADAENPDVFLLDRLFITRSFIDISTSETPSYSQRILDVNRLGVMLLELCFNMAIESHPARLRFPSSDNPKTNTMFDLIAALEWLKDVNEEAGQEYFDAIEWCLVGCRRMPMAGSGPAVSGNWRLQMLVKVTLPLQKCFQCITGDGAFDSSLNIHDSTKSGHTLALSSAGGLHEDHGSTEYSRTSTANSVLDSWDQDGLGSRSDDFTQTSIDQSNEISDILSIYKVSRQDHKEPGIGALKVHTSDSPHPVITEQRHQRLINRLSPGPLNEHSSSHVEQEMDRNASQSHFPTGGVLGNAAIEEIRRKAGLIECAITLLSYNDGEHGALSRTLATGFKLWVSVNGIFEDSLVDRFSETDDHSLLSLFINKLERLERILPDPLGDGPPLSLGLDDLQKSRHLIDSLHRVGEAMRIEFPANSLVLKIRNVLSGRESNHTNIINPSDVRQEINKSMIRLQPEQIESYVSQICEGYRVVFATLVLLYKPNRIFGFIEEKISDDKLPITKEFLVKSQRHRGWRSDDAARFVHAQHMILDRLQELSSKETKQELPETSMSSIPIRKKAPAPSLGSSTTLDQSHRASIAPLSGARSSTGNQAITESVPTKVRGSTVKRKNDQSRWRWNCCNCSFENMSYIYDIGCPSCGHTRDTNCTIWVI